MARFKIEYKNSVEHDLKRIDKQYTLKILRNIEALTINPFPPQCKKLKDTEFLYRIRVNDYRVIYQVELNTKTIIIYYIRHRKDAYK